MNRRPSLQIVAPGASPEEAVAVAAALEQFMRDTAPVLVAAPEPVNAWKQAALREGISRQPDAPAFWA